MIKYNSSYRWTDIKYVLSAHRVIRGLVGNTQTFKIPLLIWKILKVMQVSQIIELRIDSLKKR